jgi:hypothetical protein
MSMGIIPPLSSDSCPWYLVSVEVVVLYFLWDSVDGFGAD